MCSVSVMSFGTHRVFIMLTFESVNAFYRMQFLHLVAKIHTYFFATVSARELREMLQERKRAFP